MKNEFYERYPMLKENEDKIEKVIEAIITAAEQCFCAETAVQRATVTTSWANL